MLRLELTLLNTIAMNSFFGPIKYVHAGIHTHTHTVVCMCTHRYAYVHACTHIIMVFDRRFVRSHSLTSLSFDKYNNKLNNNIE